MKELDNDILYDLVAMNEQAEAVKALGAIMTTRDSVVISDRIWVCEWSIHNIENLEDNPILDEMFARRDEVFARPNDVKITPWAKLLFPDKDKYYSCDEDEPEYADEVHGTVSFTNSEGQKMAYTSAYIDTFYAICEEPEYEMYMLNENNGVLIVYDNGKRVGCVLPVPRKNSL